jgi:hypothetical protein
MITTLLILAVVTLVPECEIREAEAITQLVVRMEVNNATEWDDGWDSSSGAPFEAKYVDINDPWNTPDDGATYLEQDNPDENKYWHSFVEPSNVTGQITNYTVNVRARETSDDPDTYIRLGHWKSGSGSVYSPEYDLTTSWANYSYEFSEVSRVEDFDGTYLGLHFDATARSGSDVQVTSAYIEVWYTIDVAPTTDSCSFLNPDTTDNMYAQNKWYEFQTVHSDENGYASIWKCYFTLSNADRSLNRFVITFSEGIDSFIMNEGTDQWDLGSCDVVSKVGDTITLKWRVKPKFNATEEASFDLKVETKDYPNQDNDIEWYDDQGDVVVTLVVGNIECTDADDIVQPSQSITIEGNLYYADDPSSSSASAIYPPDSELDAVSIYNSTNGNMGTDSSIINGAFSVTFSAPAVIGDYVFNSYVDGSDVEYSDGEINTPTETVTVEGPAMFMVNTIDGSSGTHNTKVIVVARNSTVSNGTDEYLTVGGSGYGSLYGGNDIWGLQTFTTDSEFNITSVKLYVRRVDSAGDLTVSIRATSEGEPTGGDLTSGTVAEADLPTSFGWVQCNLTKYSLSSEVMYAIIMRGLGTDWGNKQIHYQTSSSGYDGGRKGVSGDSGLTWILSSNDCIFEVWGERHEALDNVDIEIYDGSLIGSGSTNSSGIVEITLTGNTLLGTGTFSINGSKESDVTYPFVQSYSVTTSGFSSDSDVGSWTVGESRDLSMNFDHGSVVNSTSLKLENCTVMIRVIINNTVKCSTNYTKFDLNAGETYSETLAFTVTGISSSTSGIMQHIVTQWGSSTIILNQNKTISILSGGGVENPSSPSSSGDDGKITLSLLIQTADFKVQRGKIGYGTITLTFQSLTHGGNIMTVNFSEPWIEVNGSLPAIPPPIAGQDMEILLPVVMSPPLTQPVGVVLVDMKVEAKSGSSNLESNEDITVNVTDVAVITNPFGAGLVGILMMLLLIPLAGVFLMKRKPKKRRKQSNYGLPSHDFELKHMNRQTSAILKNIRRKRIL